MRDSLLFLSAHLPAEHARQAGQKTVFRDRCWLAEKYRVHLIAFRNECDRAEPLEPLLQVCEHVEVVDASCWLRFRGLASNPFLPLIVVARNSRKVRQTMRNLNVEQPFSRAHFEYSQLAHYVEQLRRVPTRTLYIIDVLTQWAERRSARRSFPWRFESWRTRRWEAAHYPKFTRLFVPSRKDAQLVAGIAPTTADHLSVLPLHFDVYRSNQARDPNAGFNLLFWGALSRPENSQAARFLLHQVMPQVRRSVPEARVCILGSDPPPDLRALGGAGVAVPGFVLEPAPYFAQSQLAVLPILEGAGVKVKVLECLAAGVPVVTTEIGAEGIEAKADDGLLIAPPDAQAFASKVVELLANPDRLVDLSRSAAAWSEAQARADKAMLLME